MRPAKSPALLASVFALLASAPIAFAAADLTGKPAPEFRLQDQHGKWHTPADHRGQWLAITAPGWEALALEVIPRVVAKLP